MTISGAHVGTGLGISPYKVLSTASNYFKYFKAAEYDEIIVLDIHAGTNHKIRLIETQKNFTTSLVNNVAVITVSHSTKYGGCLHFRIINSQVYFYFYVFTLRYQIIILNLHFLQHCNVMYVLLHRENFQGNNNTRSVT